VVREGARSITATIPNPLGPSERQLEHVVAPLVVSDWLMERWPAGVKGTLSVVVDGQKVPLENCEGLVLRDGAHLLLIIMPALPVGVTFLQILVTSLISMAISAIVSAIFRPKKPAALVDQPAASPIYSISGSQNAARTASRSRDLRRRSRCSTSAHSPTPNSTTTMINT
jgi:hypothetical protein